MKIQYWTEPTNNPIVREFNGTPRECAAFARSLICSHPKASYGAYWLRRAVGDAAEMDEYDQAWEEFRAHFCQTMEPHPMVKQFAERH